MNVSNSLIPNKFVNEYQLKGGVTIIDKTDGFARVIFLEHYSGIMNKSIYQVYINDKKILYYPHFYSYEIVELAFQESKKIILENMNGFVQITEEDSNNTIKIFVDPDIGKNGMTRNVYFYSPIKTKDYVQYGIIAIGIVATVSWYIRSLKINRAG